MTEQKESCGTSPSSKTQEVKRMAMEVVKEIHSNPLNCAQSERIIAQDQKLVMLEKGVQKTKSGIQLVLQRQAGLAKENKEMKEGFTKALEEFTTAIKELNGGREQNAKDISNLNMKINIAGTVTGVFLGGFVYMIEKWFSQFRDNVVLMIEAVKNYPHGTGGG